MKKIIAVVVFLVAFAANAQDQKAQVVEASCGQCNFGMKSKGGCDLAVKVDGQTYFVDGVKMDSHGDAHGHDGMCSVVRKAEVTGQVVDGRYKATSFKLLPTEPKK